MRYELSRRALLIGATAGLVACGGERAKPVDSGRSKPPVAAPPPRLEPRKSELAEIERELGGRVGVFALHTGSGDSLAHRADERFAMCSTFKWVLAAAVLERVDRGELRLNDTVPYGAKDVLEYAPVARAHLVRGEMTLDALADAAVTLSDNTAANLLLAKIGGPAGLTRFMRDRGDGVTRLDRDEPALNTNLPNDPRDTTTPRAMVGLLRAVLLGKVLSAESRDRLIEWMRVSPTGRERLRAGFPPSWDVGDKTGTCSNSAANDVAIAWPEPGGAPVLVASYMSEAQRPPQELFRGHARIGQLIGERWGKK